MSVPGEQEKTSEHGRDGTRQKTEQYESIVTAINGVTNQLLSNEKEQKDTDKQGAFRENLTIWLLIGTVILTAAADFIFYQTMDEARRSAIDAHEDNARALVTTEGAGQDALFNSRIQGDAALDSANAGSKAALRAALAANAIARNESVAAQRAADAALKSADALAAETEIRRTEFGIEHRPKLTVHINPAYRALEVTKQGIGIGVSATVTNERNTEADEVGYGFEFGPADSEPEMAKRQEIACSAAETDNQKRTIGIGGSFTWNMYVVEGRGPSFLSMYPNVSFVDMSPRRYAIAGCVVYTSPFDKTTIRHTKFLYYVDEIVNGTSARGIVQMPHKVEPRNLDFKKDDFAGNNDD